MCRTKPESSNVNSGREVATRGPSYDMAFLEELMSWNQQQQPWISASTAEMDVRERSFIRSVYGWMFGGLLLTAVAALWVVMSPAMQQLVIANPIIRFGLFIAELGIVFYLSLRLT